MSHANARKRYVWSILNRVFELAEECSFAICLRGKSPDFLCPEKDLEMCNDVSLEEGCNVRDITSARLKLLDELNRNI